MVIALESHMKSQVLEWMQIPVCAKRIEVMVSQPIAALSKGEQAVGFLVFLQPKRDRHFYKFLPR